MNREGKWYGYNTDGAGFVGALVLDGYDLKEKRFSCWAPVVLPAAFPTNLRSKK